MLVGWCLLGVAFSRSILTCQGLESTAACRLSHRANSAGRGIDACTFALPAICPPQEKQKPSKKVWSFLVLYLFDLFQVLAIVSSSQFGWNDPISKLVRMAGGALESAVSYNSSFTFALAYFVVVILVWTSLIDAAYVSYSFSVNRVTRIWTVKLLRGLVSVLLTVGLIPSLKLLAVPMHMSEIESATNDNDVPGWMQTALIALSVVTMVLLIPFALAFSLVYYNNNPSSTELKSRSSGRMSFLHTMMRVSLVLVTQLLTDGNSSRNALVALFILAMMIQLYGGMCLRQPFHRLWINQMYAGGYCFGAAMALASIVLSCYDFGPDARRNIGIVATIMGLIVSPAAGWMGPMVWRRKLMQRAEQLFSHEVGSGPGALRGQKEDKDSVGRLCDGVMVVCGEVLLGCLM